MKTPPDLRQEASISVVTSNREIRQDGPTPFCLSLTSKSNQKSVSATKDAGLSRTAAQLPRGYTARGRNQVDHSCLPLKGLNEYHPGRIRMGKWALHARYQRINKRGPVGKSSP